MPRWSQLARPLLTAAAVLLAATATLYACLWMYAVRHQQAPVELGFDPNFSAVAQAIAVLRVYPGSPAERAGLRENDRIVAVNGRVLDSINPFNEIWYNAHPGDSVELTVVRPGTPGTLQLRGTFRVPEFSSQESLARSSALQVLGSYPVSFLLVGLTVLFLRREDGIAWLLALMFCSFIAAANLPNIYSLSPALRPFFLAYRAVFLGLLGALFYIFFAVFPGPSPLERRVPWLKWVGLALGASVTLPGLRQGEMSASAAFFSHWVGSAAARAYVLGGIYGFLFLGLVSLVGNAFSAANPVVTRKSRLILWGTAAGVLPVVAEKAAMDFTGFQPPFWLDTALVVNIALFPLTFAYVVVKHRVMEIPVLLKRSARYVFVQRGFLVLLFLIASVMISTFTRAFSRFFPAGSNLGMTVSAVFGIALVWASAPLIRRGTDRIDRAFFRSAYDARMILQDLAEKARTVNDRHQLAALLERHIQEALHPKFLAGYLEAEDGRLAAEFGPVPPGLASLDPAMPLLAELLRRGGPWLEVWLEKYKRTWEDNYQRLDALLEVPTPELREDFDLSAWAPLQPECLVPILGRENRLIGLLVLGERLSEEPYSSEDARLLESAASQAGVGLEGIRLGEKIAERMEVERRSALEVEIARQVQSKLFPQKMPPLATLEYAGGCVQARVVGGDYYDFLELGPGRLAIILADISGKGIAGALLMANLQANLRSQYALALDNLPRLLHSVNRLFCENIPEDRFATLFFADYEDAGRRLRYVNCGHNYPLLLRADGSLERLASTATVLGMFLDWDCSVVETTMHPGDILVMYTDGVTEAPNAQGEEFGEKRLLETIRAQKLLSAAALLDSISNAVQGFSSGIQADDLTLVVARAR
jgi:sigma-B regulation protein RsbU (phosphoserine phosphatase)